MDRSLKRDLPGKLESIAPEYGLVELVYPSFGRAFGFQMALLSAADAVEGLEALLEAAKGIRMEIEVDGGKGGGEWFGGMRTWSLDANGNGDVPAAEELETLEQDRAAPKIHNWHVQNFWTSYDACDE
jgi:cell division control protein 45